jgi:hypothetical protein
LEQLLTSASFTSIMLTIGKRITRFVRMKRKNIPQEYPRIDLIQHAPYNRCRPFRNGCPYSRPFSDNVPPLGMFGDVNVIRQREPSAASSAVPEIPTDPDGIDWFTHSIVEHG